MAQYLLTPKKAKITYKTKDGKEYELTRKPLVYQTAPPSKPRGRGDKYVFGKASTAKV